MTDIEAQPPATDPSASQPTPAPIGQRAVSDAEAPREKHPQCRLGCTFAATPAGPCAGGTCAMAWATEGNAAPPGLGTPRSEAVTGPVGELPEDAIEAAAKALAAQEGDDYDGSIYGADPAVLFVWGDHARAALAAALPFLERATRDKIAAAGALHAPKRLHPEFRFRPWCDECSTGDRSFGDDGAFTHRVYWPCKTAQALGMIDPLDPARVARGGEATE